MVTFDNVQQCVSKRDTVSLGDGYSIQLFDDLLAPGFELPSI